MRPESRAFTTAMMLAWVAGFVDAAGYLVVSLFTAHMSGNTVAAAAHFGAGPSAGIFRRGFPIPMFVAGVFLGAIIARLGRRSGRRHRFQPSFILELALLCGFMGLTRQWKRHVPTADFRAELPAALLAIGMGLQSATLRFAGETAVRTTFITGILVNMAEKAAGYVDWSLAQFKARRRGNFQADFFERHLRRQRRETVKYALLWCGMFFGAICGGYLETLWGSAALLFPTALLACVIFWDLIKPIPGMSAGGRTRGAA